MPLFQTTINIDHKLVAQILLKNWNLELGKILKASQNHTFQAFSLDKQKKYSVRVTPDPQKKHIQRITDEMFVVNYWIKSQLKHLVTPIAPNTETEHKLFLVEGDIIIVVFQWARGVPLNFVEFRWMKDKTVIFAWGRFFAQLHKLSRKFQIDYPEVAKRIQKWDQIHCGILKGTKLHPDDIALIDNPQYYGTLHGDLNLSNIHYVDDGDYLSVFDTDQIQRGYYLFDVAQAIYTLVMLEDGGMPLNGDPVEGASRKQFQQVMVAGYESQGLKVDIAMLDRMVQIKKQLYLKFASQSAKEGNTPPDMAPFLKYIQQKCAPKWKLEQ